MAGRKKILFALDGYDAEMQKGIVDYGRTQDWQVQVVSPSHGPVYQFWKGDGIISCLSTDRNDPMTQFVLNFPGPKVELSKYFEDEGFARVFEDSQKIAELSARYFIDKGFRHFYYLSEQKFWATEDRGFYFRQELQKHGFDCEMTFLRADVSDWSKCFDYLGEKLKSLPKPCAIFCGFDREAQWAAQVAQSLNIQVPETLAILGTANHRMICEWGDVAISSVDSNRRFWCYRAGEVLNEMFEGKVKPEDTFLIPPKEIVERQSSDIASVADRELGKALKFISQHLDKNLTVADVAMEAGVSISTLSRRFKEFRGQSFKQEVNAMKIHEAKKLLREGKLSAVTIAEKLAFSSPYYFYRVFKEVTSMTCMQYQAKHSGE